jgi:hypothetical protein
MAHPLSAIPDPFTPPIVNPFADTAEIDLSKPVGENVDGALHLALPLTESHSELLSLAKDCQAVLLVHGTAMIGERNHRLCERLESAIAKGRSLT